MLKCLLRFIIAFFIFNSITVVVHGAQPTIPETNDLFETELDTEVDSNRCLLQFGIFDARQFEHRQQAQNFCNGWFNRGFNRQSCFFYEIHGGRWEGRFRFGQQFDGHGRGYSRQAIFSDLFDFLERRRLWSVIDGSFPFNFQFRGGC